MSRDSFLISPEWLNMAMIEMPTKAATEPPAALLLSALGCPSCGQILSRDRCASVLTCGNPQCASSGVCYALPTIALTVVPGVKVLTGDF